MKRSICIVLLLSMAILSACGSGNDGGTLFLPPSSNQPTAATVKLVTTATGTTIYCIDATVTLAPGVTVRSSNPPFADDGVVSAASGTMAPLALYTAASGTYPGKVRVMVLNEEGFALGEICTINANIARGYAPGAADFSLESFLATDATGTAIDTAEPGLRVRIH